MLLDGVHGAVAERHVWRGIHAVCQREHSGKTWWQWGKARSCGNALHERHRKWAESESNSAGRHLYRQKNDPVGGASLKRWLNEVPPVSTVLSVDRGNSINLLFFEDFRRPQYAGVE